ncbi:MAG: PIN domain nuclease [Bacteroidales bacterium]|nr:PIN domain nuclease [Bacteroidales bacterium]
MILVDSSVWIDYFNGIRNSQTKKLDDFLENDLVTIGDIILTEVLQGFRNDSDYRLAKTHLTKLHCYAISNKNMALKSAENFRKLRKMGLTVRKKVDMLIGTFCIENKIPLLTNDKDFEMIAHLGLKLV